jgi:chemotaxis protein methyltransferase CheR
MTSEILLDSATDVIVRSVGLRLDPAQRNRLDYWLKTTARQRGVASSRIVEEIVAEGPALQAVLDELTVQETSFFRDPGQFEALRTTVLGTLREPIRIWSAGCAWGQEPYSLAMTLDAAGISAWQVVASDISSKALGQAQSGRYTERQLAGLTDEQRSRYLDRVGDGHWEVIPRLRRRVHVFRHNLVRDPVPHQARGAAIVFCRNVLIYVDRSDVLAALDGIHRAMDPRGWLFLGYSESLWQVTQRFRLVRVGRAFAYRRPEWLDQPAPADPAAAPRRRRPAAAPPPAPSRTAPSRIAPPRPVPPPRATGPGADGAAAAPLPPVSALLAEGEAALQAGDHAGAIQALRKAAYLDPDHGVAQFQLGLAFDRIGEPREARRAFLAARAALGRSSAAAEAALEGYQIAELIRVIGRHLHAGASRP